MKTNRHVLVILGSVSVGVAIAIMLMISEWWKYLIALPLLMFGVSSIKTGLFETDRDL